MALIYFKISQSKFLSVETAEKLKPCLWNWGIVSYSIACPKKLPLLFDKTVKVSNSSSSVSHKAVSGYMMLADSHKQDLAAERKACIVRENSDPAVRCAEVFRKSGGKTRLLERY